MILCCFSESPFSVKIENLLIPQRSWRTKKAQIVRAEFACVFSCSCLRILKCGLRFAFLSPRRHGEQGVERSFF